MTGIAKGWRRGGDAAAPDGGGLVVKSGQVDDFTTRTFLSDPRVESGGVLILDDDSLAVSPVVSGGGLLDVAHAHLSGAVVESGGVVSLSDQGDSLEIRVSAGGVVEGPGGLRRQVIIDGLVSGGFIASDHGKSATILSGGVVESESFISAADVVISRGGAALGAMASGGETTVSLMRGGLMSGVHPLAVLSDATGNQRLIRLGSEIDPDSMLISVGRDSAAVIFRGKMLRLSLVGDQNAK